MGKWRILRLAPTIVSKFCTRVPEGATGAGVAGLAAFYQARRVSTLPLVEDHPQADKVRDLLSSAPLSLQSNLDPATVTG